MSLAARRFALVVGSTLFALLSCEGILRWQLRHGPPPPKDDPEWRARYRRMNRALYRRSDDPRLVYEPTPGSAMQMEYGLAAFNSAGMRDPREHAVKPAPERPRVAMVGDSLVWGELVAVGDALPQALERALGGRAEVLNFGVSGYDLAQETIWYERAVRRFHPEIVVVVFCMNDLMIMSGPYKIYMSPAEERRKQAQDEAFDRAAPVRRETLDRALAEDESQASLKILARARAIYRRATYARSADYADEYTITFGEANRVAALGRDLGALAAAIRGDGARAVLVISPVLEAWGHYRWDTIHRTVAGAARAAGFQVLDPLDDWRGRHDPEALRVPGDNLHFNARGNAVLADFLAGAIPLGR